MEVKSNFENEVVKKHHLSEFGGRRIGLKSQRPLLYRMVVEDTQHEAEQSTGTDTRKRFIQSTSLNLQTSL